MIELYELNPHKMTTSQEKAQCVSWFIETKSDVQTQRNYRSKIVSCLFFGAICRDECKVRKVRCFEELI